MDFYGYNADADNCYWTPYSNTYDDEFPPTQIQDSPSHYYDSGESQLLQHNSSSYYRDDSFVTPPELNYSVYSFSEPKLLHYDPPEYRSPYDNYYEYSANPTEINYSSFSEPRLLQFEPTPYDVNYFQSETKFRISYSKSADFYDDEFEDYDPTPYGGGYDQTIAYGKPLPPSDDICHPKSMPLSGKESLENFSYSSIPSPYGRDDEPPNKLPTETKPIDTKPENVIKTLVENGDKISSDGRSDEVLQQSDVIPSDDSSTSDEDEKGFENGISSYESERQVSRIPYGSGLETLDICESIFGYWPCLAKIEQQRRNKCCQQERRMDPWEDAADYLFGRPGVYDYQNYHHQQQQQVQYDCYENSWMQ